MDRLADGQLGFTHPVVPFVPNTNPVPNPVQSPFSHYKGLAAHQILEHTAEILPDREAVRYGDYRWTYEELLYDVNRLTVVLQKLGVSKGDRVGILLPNVPEYIIAANAIWQAGGIVVAINPMMVANEVKRLVETTDCSVIISLDLLSQLLPKKVHGRMTQVLLVSIRHQLTAIQQLGYLWKRHAQTGHWMLFDSSNKHWLWKEIERIKESPKLPDIDPEKDSAYILPTGGTTGVPKAVALSHRNMVANAWQQYEWAKGSFGVEKMLAVLPFFHSYGMSATVMGGTMMGATLILHHRFNPQQVLQMIEEHRPTVFHAVPAMLVALNEKLRRYPTDMTSIHWVISGGAPLDCEVAGEFAEKSGALVVEGFGLSEASPVTHVGNLFAEPRYGVIGLPLPETECRIAHPDDGTVDVADGDVGELLIRGPQVMLGYWNDEAATKLAIQDGWLHTGDLAMKEPDGYYKIVGRKKDLIITSGFNVYPSEIEDVLREHPDIADAAVVGAKDNRRGEIVKAFIVLAPGATWSEESVQDFCRTRLATYKRPKEYVLHKGDLPKNFLGKVLRRELRGD